MTPLATEPQEPLRADWPSDESYIIALRAYANCLRGLYELEQAHNVYLTKTVNRASEIIAGLTGTPIPALKTD